MNIGRLIWGLILTAFGILLILVNFGYADLSVFSYIWRLWPLILVFIGLSVIGKGGNTFVNILIGIIALLIIGAAITAVVNPERRGAFNIREQSSSQEYTYTDDLTDEIKSAEILIQTGAGKLDIDGKSDQLFSASVITSILEPKYTKTLKDSVAQIELSSTSSRNFNFRGDNNWQVSLNKDLPTKLELNTGAMDAEIDLENSMVNNVDIKGGASSYQLRLSSRPDLSNIDLSLGASSVKLELPKNIGIKITSESGLSSINFRNFSLNKSGNQYTSESYDSAPKKIDINLKTGASSIDISQY